MARNLDGLIAAHTKQGGQRQVKGVSLHPVEDAAVLEWLEEAARRGVSTSRAIRYALRHAVGTDTPLPGEVDTKLIALVLALIDRLLAHGVPHAEIQRTAEAVGLSTDMLRSISQNIFERDGL